MNHKQNCRCRNQIWIPSHLKHSSRLNDKTRIDSQVRGCIISSVGGLALVESSIASCSANDVKNDNAIRQCETNKECHKQKKK